MTAVLPLDRARATRLVVALLVALTALRLAYALLIGPAPQEAYYWEFARHLDWGYLDHPPMSAWWIAATTALFGENAFAIHLPAILGGAALGWLLFRLGTRLYGPGVGLVAFVVANATVLFGIGAVVITPDVPLLVFWTWALLVFVELVLPDGEAGPGAWYLVGALVGAAMLGKYTAGLLPVQLLVTSLVLPRGRRWLRTPHPYLGVGVALLVFLPVVLWNAAHDWASFAFQTTRRASEVNGFHGYLLARYLGLQALAATPLVYLSLWWAAGRGGREALKGRPEAVVLALASLPGLALFTLVSPFHWVKMNWVAPAYVGLLILLAHAWWSGRAQRRVRAWAGASVAVGVVFTLAIHLMPLVPAVPFPQKDNLLAGWDQLAGAVSERLEAPAAADPFVVGWDYKTASELAFHLPGHARTTSANAFGGNGLMYGMWFDPAAHAGRDALVVSDRRHRLRDAEARLSKGCRAVEALPPVTVTHGAQTVTTFDLWWCRGWHVGG